MWLQNSLWQIRNYYQWTKNAHQIHPQLHPQHWLAPQCRPPPLHLKSWRRLRPKSVFWPACKTAFSHVKYITRLRPSLSSTAAETLIHAFVTFRLNYCNSLLYSSPSKILDKLHYIHNSAACPLTHSRTHDHIPPVLYKHHWLLIP